MFVDYDEELLVKQGLISAETAKKKYEDKDPNEKWCHDTFSFFMPEYLEIKAS